MITLHEGDCLDVLATLDADSVHACVTDPPYGLEFMGVAWDTFSTPKGGSRPRNEWGDFGSREHARTAKDAARVARNKNRAFEEFSYEWAQAIYRVLKPGAYLMAFGGTRTWARMSCAIEDAGFEIRDTLCWLYGSGFPKSHDISKAIDKTAGADRTEIVGSKLGRPGMAKDGSNQRSGFDAAFGGQASGAMSTDILAPATPEATAWAGWGTALKPAFEPIILARKPLVGTVAANVLAHGTGAINIDGCRVPSGPDHAAKCASVIGLDSNRNGDCYGEWTGKRTDSYNALGRWPANLITDGSPQVEAAFAAFGEKGGGHWHNERSDNAIFGKTSGGSAEVKFDGTGTASRFFQRCEFTPDELRIHYTAKADKADRADSKHPTIKPVSLLRWLVRLVCPPEGTIVDPFAGSGTTGEAAMLEGFNALLIEQSPEHAADIRHRIKRWSGEDTPLFARGASSPVPLHSSAPDNPACEAEARDGTGIIE